MGTGILGCCVAAISDKRNNIPAHLHPLLGGFVVAMIGMCFGMNCGYPINPGRDLGPRIFTLIAGYGWEVFRLAQINLIFDRRCFVSLFSFNHYKWFWIPIVGPTLGAVIGAWVYKLLIGIHWPDDVIPERHADNKPEEIDLLTRKA